MGSKSSDVGCSLCLVMSSRPEPGVVWRNYVCQRSENCKSTWLGVNVERTLTDLRGVGGFERFLSSKHFRRGPHGMSYRTRNRNAQRRDCVELRNGAVIKLLILR